VPVIVREEVVGFLALDKTEPNFYTPQIIEHLTAFAALAGIALENARLYAEQQRLAVTDGLTGLANRRWFDEALGREMERSKRFHHPLGLILLDIDNFKQYNDCYGHPTGDNLLKNLAEVLKRNLRDVDTAARYGGEEFAVILPEADLSSACSLAERLRDRIAHLHSSPPLQELAIPDQPVTVSLGVAVTSDRNPDIETLVRDADAALYDAKRSGKNRVSTLACDEGDNRCTIEY
jgi:diguanylate cyclase (GGDEF)-like protein